ncbi:PQQ-binding-like beta-propeller repeat protein [Candidatus Poribacteria bacterium]|nr:PQQ-binding-like beta-propeller repeat protein [Candidatus Poribacteria bacterium]
MSNDGISWEATTDTEGVPIVIERFAVDGTTVYGTHQQRVYQLKANANTWQQVTPEIPVRVNALAVDGNTLYVGTTGRGVLRFTLDESE